MTKRAAVFFKGQRLHENAQLWRIGSTATLGRLAGVYRLFGFLNPRSRNRYTEVMVVTAVRPKTGTATLDRQTQLGIALEQCHDALAIESNTLGPLAWSQDDSELAAVLTTHQADDAAQVVNISPPNWAPRVGAYIVCRKPSKNADPSSGFVARIEAAGASSLTFVVQQDIDGTWEVRPVQKHYPDMAYDTYTDGGGPSPSVDWHRTGPTVSWRFVGGQDCRMTIDPQDAQDLG